ncbi:MULTISPECIES: SPL family radical SAM protein [Halorussus]|uniref:SPL family radical SAM protein n=1 Tax=Halorussus TaxID=1070314 RepID=UPI0020A0A692|nr:radical SAM protein [Halorussus vallis]USZ78606.1 radical SAM protein [Halorussus vallis]
MNGIESVEVRTAEDPTKTILSKSALSEKHLCDYVINVATGCRHGCQFCYVPATPNIRTRGEMLAEHADVADSQQEWGEYVLYRDTIPEELPGLLDRKRTWKRTENGCGIVGLSFSTDCYMDRRAGDITRAAVETLAEHGHYARVLTRNPLNAVRHLDTFREAGEHVIVGSSINSLDANELGAVERRAPSPDARLRGLERFADAGVPVFVSMSPTYPTMDRADLRELMVRISALDPAVVFHEPINPRGANFDMTVEAAWSAGEDDLGAALARLRGREQWVEYACQHFQWVQELAEELDVPIHLWPDKQLVATVDGERERWLQAWRERQSPEAFAGRDTPDEGLPPLPSALDAYQEDR